MPTNLDIHNKVRSAFAAKGEKTDLPLTKQPSGKASYEEGFGQKYSTPLTAGGEAIDRKSFNSLLNQITDDLSRAKIQLKSREDGITITVGPNGDFQSLNEAIAYASRFEPGGLMSKYGSGYGNYMQQDGSLRGWEPNSIFIVLQSDFILTESISESVSGKNLYHIVITSEGREVKCQYNTGMWFINAYAAYLPKFFNVKFNWDVTGTGGNSYGISLNHNSHLVTDDASFIGICRIHCYFNSSFLIQNNNVAGTYSISRSFGCNFHSFFGVIDNSAGLTFNVGNYNGSTDPSSGTANVKIYNHNSSGMHLVANTCNFHSRATVSESFYTSYTSNFRGSLGTCNVNINRSTNTGFRFINAGDASDWYVLGGTYNFNMSGNNSEGQTLFNSYYFSRLVLHYTTININYNGNFTNVARYLSSSSSGDSAQVHFKRCAYNKNSLPAGWRDTPIAWNTYGGAGGQYLRS